eukprot:gene17337-biopygen26269
MFRLDITAIRFAAVPQGYYSKSQSSNYTGWFTQHVLGAAETYEFEVEMVTFMYDDDDNSDTTIFEHAAAVLQRCDSGLYLYHIDGLVFTPAKIPVGGTFDDDDAAAAAKRPSSSWSRIRTWREVLKWKPPEDSTIDFLVKFTDVDVDGDGATVADDKQQQHVDLLVGYNTDAAVGGNDGIRDLRSFLEASAADTGKRRPPASKMTMMSMKCENGDLISDGMVVEFAYRGDPSSHHSPANWVPMRVRYDKTESAAATGRVTANNYETVMNVWRTIVHPVSEAIITGRETLDEASSRADLVKSVYFMTCWRSAQVDPRGASKVTGIDKFASNLTDPVNGSYARALQTKEKLMSVGGWEAGRTIIPESDRLIVYAALHGNNDKNKTADDDVVARGMENFAKEGTFDLATCMFAIHYFFESPARLAGLCRNVAAVLRPGGTFVGISPDGDALAAALSSKDVGEFVEGKSSSGGSASSLLWRITKRHTGAAASAKNKYGRQVDVFVESIGQDIPEYLMDYKELVRAMGEVGMRPLTSAELKTSGLGRYSTGMMEPLFDKVIGKENDAKVVVGKENDDKVTLAEAAIQKLLDAPPALRELLKNKMTPEEKQYSFFSRWFAFRKKKDDSSDSSLAKG